VIRDYENDRVLDTVTGPVATIETAFAGHLLVVAEPAN
jgi:hypothetical protein